MKQETSEENIVRKQARGLAWDWTGSLRVEVDTVKASQLVWLIRRELRTGLREVAPQPYNTEHVCQPGPRSLP